jgi:uncharacterized protein YecE (DUF72 family)
MASDSLDSVKPKAEREPTLFEMEKPGDAAELAADLNLQREYSEANLYLGTSSFTADGWAGSFYPKGMQPREYLSHYAKTFRTVEIDSTFYATPSEATVLNWYQRTPADFVFAVKVPQVITHEKVLQDCGQEFDEFKSRMELLGEKLGPVLFQFPFFSGKQFRNVNEFVRRLESFLKKAQGTGWKIAIEIRNEKLLDGALRGMLRERNVALALTDTSFLPRPWEMTAKCELMTADFVYVRWLGNRKDIEKQTTTWDKTVVDRREDLRNWVELFRQFMKRDVKVYAYANNHYAGNGPNTVRLFWDMWKG